MQGKSSPKKDGKAVRKQLCKKLADVCDAYRNEKSVRPLADEVLGPINAGTQDIRGTMAISDFIEGTFLPEVQRDKRPSTYKNYTHIFQIHVKPRLGEIALRQFRCCDGETLLRDVARQNKKKNGDQLRHNTLERIKSFLSGVFATARRLGALDTQNPMRDTRVPAGSPPSVTHAYSLAQTNSMLAVLPEPVKTIILTFALTGLRQGEVRGLRWQDFNGKELRVERSIWDGGVINRPKTPCSAAPIPVVKQLRDALELHRQRMGKLASPELPIFQSGVGTPLNLENVARRIIIPKIEKCVVCRRPKHAHKPESHLFELDKTLCWHGFHGFRRGLATNLHALGIPDREIQAILRHSNINVTQHAYIKSIPQSQVNALDRLAAEMAKDQSCNDSATEVKGPVN